MLRHLLLLLPTFVTSQICSEDCGTIGACNKYGDYLEYFEGIGTQCECEELCVLNFNCSIYTWFDPDHENPQLCVLFENNEKCDSDHDSCERFCHMCPVLQHPIMPPNPDFLPGMIVSGGSPFSASTSIETFPSAGCAIPPFPAPGRDKHSLSLLSTNALVACGGLYTLTSCIRWSKGLQMWADYFPLRLPREYHSAATMDNDTILILGGRDSQTAELVPGGETFPLEHSSWDSCAIQISKSEVVMIGGGYPTHGHVDRYNSTGFLGPLPNLITARFDHACSAYESDGALILLVTGGTDGLNRMATTEVLLPGSITWEKRSSLPWEAYDLRGATLPHFFDKGGEILVAGGTDNSFLQRGEVLQYIPGNDSWVEVGRLKSPRAYHAIVAGDLSEICL